MYLRVPGQLEVVPPPDKEFPESSNVETGSEASDELPEIMKGCVERGQ